MMKAKPAALAKLGVAEKKRLAAKGRKAIAVVLREKRRIESSFYAMGRALETLKDVGVVHALGHALIRAAT